MLGDLTAAGSPAGMRVIVRRERPHPGAQLSFTDVDGWRFGEFRHRHPGRAARAPGGPAPRSCPGRGSDPLRQEHRPESAAFAAVRDQRRLGRARPDRGGPDRLDPDHPARGRAGPRRARDVALPTAPRRRPDRPRATTPRRPHRLRLALARTARRSVQPAPHPAPADHLTGDIPPIIHNRQARRHRPPRRTLPHAPDPGAAEPTRPRSPPRRSKPY